MTWVIESAKPFARGVDTIDSTDLAKLAPQVRAEGFDFAYVYLGGATAAQCIAIASVMPIIPVTFGNRTDPSEAIGNMTNMGLPWKDPSTGTPATLLLDAEAQSNPVASLIATWNAWAAGIQKAGARAGIYEGEENTPVTAEQYGDLLFTGYWKSASAVPLPTFHGQSIGWMCTQFLPANYKLQCGLVVDVDMIAEDYFGRVPTWMRWA
jgi:hypothetical protein